MNKIIITMAALALLVGAGSLGISKVYAQESGINNHPMMQNLVERFNLNQDEVNQFLEEQRRARQEQHKASFEERLSKAVSEGKITEDQKNALLTKMEEKHQAMQTSREEFKSWAEQNGIDLTQLNLGHGGFRKGGRMFKGF